MSECDSSFLGEASPATNSREWWESYFAGTWEQYDGSGQTRHFMTLVVKNLPPPELRYLRASPVSVLDWGCAFGEGLAVLKTAFPLIDITGLDFAETAIAEASRRHSDFKFLHTPDGSIPGTFDVIVTSNCLEHFEKPLDIARMHISACQTLYIVLVPYNEQPPMHPHHRAQLREESFPDRLGGFVRLHTAVVAADPPWWNGQQLLVVYGTPRYAHERLRSDDSVPERAIWSAVYASAPPEVPGEDVGQCGVEFATHVSHLLPDGGRVLEVGYGGGWSTHALARTGRLAVTVIDPSENTLASARADFEHESLSADFVLGDVMEPEVSERHDLVFNVGGIEHDAFEGQVAFLKGMAQRSSRYVLVLSHNSDCYWYWLWRVAATARGEWPFGKEVPSVDLSAAFAEAGLFLVGRTTMAARWTEYFLASLPGLSDETRHELLRLHRSPLISPTQKSYFVATLGSVRADETQVPTAWTRTPPPTGEAPELATALADALALNINRENSLADREAEIRFLARQADESKCLIAGLEEDVQRLTHERNDVELNLRRKLQEVTSRFHAQSEGGEVAKFQREIAEIRGSVSWRLGNRIVNTARAVPGMKTVARRVRGHPQDPPTANMSS